MIRYINKKTNKEELIADRNSSSWFGTVYLKSFHDKDDNRGPWHIRLEVTLRDKALERIVGKALSCDPAVMHDRLKNIQLWDIWDLEEFDWERFIHSAKESYDKKRPHKSIAVAIMINFSGVFQLPGTTERASKIEQNKGRNYYAYAVRRKRGAGAIIPKR